MDSKHSQTNLRVSECNDRSYNLNSARRVLVVGRYPLHHTANRQSVSFKKKDFLGFAFLK